MNNDQPTFDQLLEICGKGKFIFADIVKGIKEEIPAYEIPIDRCVMVNNNYEWKSKLIGGKKVGEYSDTHLDIMGKKSWLNDNVEEILKFINRTPSLKHVYFT